MFGDLMVNIKTEICHNIFRSASSMMAFEQFLHNLPQNTVHQEASAFSQGTTTGTASGSTTTQVTRGSRGGPNPADMVSEAATELSKAKPVRTGPKVGRNDPCPCASGKKFKQCCGKNA